MTKNGKKEVNPVRTAITGCGGVTNDVLEVIHPFPELDIRLLHDINPVAAKSLASKYDIDDIATDFNEILADDIELIVINTPNHLHKPQAIAALSAGKHCLIQKPIARNSTEAKDIVNAADSAGAMLGVVMEERGNIVYRQMKEMIESGCIGEVKFFRCGMAHTVHLNNPPPPGDWRASEETIGGGSFIQLGIHHIDLTQWMLGSGISNVSAVSSSEVNPELFPNDETTRVSARFANGVTASFTTSFTFDADEFFIQGSDGFVGRSGSKISWLIKSAFDGEAFKCPRAGASESMILDWYPSRPRRFTPEYEQHRAFALAIRGEAEFEATGEIALDDLLVVEAVHESAKSGEPVSISR